MASSKKQASTAPLWPARLAAWLLGPGRPALLTVIVVTVFGGGWYWWWHRIGPRVLDQPEYHVGPEHLDITPLPRWIHSDVHVFRAEVFRDPTLDGPLSLMDDGLTHRIAKAFAAHPWVAKVERVTKHHPNSGGAPSVKVELTYRRPVCMVELPGEPRLLPVDAEGVLLPGEGFSTVEAAGFPRLGGVWRKPLGPPGNRWSDPAVIGGAEIAAAVIPVWDAARLQRIVGNPPNAGAPGNVGGDSSRRSLDPTFVLVTRSGTQIFWGYAPVSNVLGEMPAAEKVAAIQRYLADRDSLDDPQGKPQQLDIRTMGSSPRR